MCDCINTVDPRHRALFNEVRKHTTLNSNQNTEIAAGAFQGLVNLNLSANKITEILAGAVQGLVSLTTNSNEIIEIAAGAFQGLGKLEKLDLNGNNLTSITNGGLRDTPRDAKLDQSSPIFPGNCTIDSCVSDGSGRPLYY